MVVAAVLCAGRALAPKIEGVLSYGVGAIAVSYVILVLMLLHRAGMWQLIGLLLVAIAAGIRHVQWSWYKPSLLIAPFFIWYLVNAMAPEIQADPNTYHLQPAIDSLQLSGFSDKITFYDRLPHAIEMLFVPAWRIGGASSAKLVEFSFLLATLPLFVLLARRLGFSDWVGQVAGALYFMAPIVGVAGTAAFNDAALVFCIVATVILAIDDEPLWCGLLAGFCYSVKMTGILVIPVVLAYFAFRRQWRSLAICGVMAGLSASPWLIKNFVETGNPFAPFFNRWFPNPYFYVATEIELTQQMKTYGIDFWHRFPEVLWGDRLQGMIGITFLFAPVALLSIRKRPIAILLAIAALLSISWWTNAGARFVLAVLPFLAIAMVASLPRKAAIAVLTLQAIACWPQIVFLYRPKTFQIPTFPWKAALRIESEKEYLTRTSEEYRFARFVEENTPPDAHIFDMLGLYSAHIRRDSTAFWRSASAVRAFKALQSFEPLKVVLIAEWKAAFPAGPVCGFRMRPTADAELWSLLTVDLRYDGEPRRSEGWTISTPYSLYDVFRAFDRSPVSRWSTWQPVHAGTPFEVQIEPPVTADSLRVLAPAAENVMMRLELCRDGRWQPLDATAIPGPDLNLRPGATALLKREGFTHIVTGVAYTGVGWLGEKLVNQADDWNLEVVNNLYTVYVLKIR